MTDVAGSEFTLVPSSSSTHSDHDSDDSLDGQHSITFQGNLVSPTYSAAPDYGSITTGVARKLSLEIDQQHHHPHHHHQHQHHLPSSQHHHHFDQRRDSDKSLAFSDDSLSNDSVQLSPSQDGPSAASSSGFKSGGESHSEATCYDPTDQTARLSPDSLSGTTTSTMPAMTTTTTPPNDECYEMALPYECYNLDATRILEIVKQTIDSKMPPVGFVLNQDTTVDGGIGAAPPSSIHNLSLEYSGGLQIELQVCDGRRPAVGENGTPMDGNNEAAGVQGLGNMGLKMRRISGDQFEYGKLCQQLISSLTV